MQLKGAFGGYIVLTYGGISKVKKAVLEKNSLSVGCL